MNRAIVLMVASAAVLTACSSDKAEEPTVVDVTVTEMAFAPTTVNATKGQTVTFVFRNEGKVKHEAVFGNLSEQEAHHAEMAEAAEASGHESDSGSMHDGDSPEMHSVVVEPGQTVEVTHKVEGTTIVGCHEPGHWEAGMKMELNA